MHIRMKTMLITTMREAHTPMREETVFRLASVSKPLVSAAALALVDQGKLRLGRTSTQA